MAKKTTTAAAAAPTRKDLPQDLPFEIKTIHKKALLQLLQCHHSGNIQLTYLELSNAMGVGKNTKSWQGEAWKELRNGHYIVQGSSKGKFCLSPEGVDLAMCFCSEEELADYRKPLSNDELHKKIRNKLDRDSASGNHKHCGSKIFDVLLQAHAESKFLTRLEMADQLGVNPDSHGFFYGFGALKKMNLVTEVRRISREELKRKFDLLHTAQTKDDDATSTAKADTASTTITTSSQDKVKKQEPNKTEKPNVTPEMEKRQKVSDDEAEADTVTSSSHDEVEKTEPDQTESAAPEKKKQEVSDDDEVKADIVPSSSQEKGKKDKVIKTETAAAPKKKKRKKSNRIRGGCQLFKLSETAFLTSTP